MEVGDPRLDFKTVVFFSQNQQEIGEAWRVSLTRAKLVAREARRACETREKKTDCPFSIQ